MELNEALGSVPFFGAGGFFTRLSRPIKEHWFQTTLRRWLEDGRLRGQEGSSFFLWMPTPTLPVQRSHLTMVQDGMVDGVSNFCSECQPEPERSDLRPRERACSLSCDACDGPP